jgi:hypothetical protein
MTEKLYTDLLRLAKKRLRKTANMLRYVSITDPEDLVHGFVASSYYDADKPAAFTVHDFSQYCVDMVRDGIRRREAGAIVVNSQNMTLNNHEGNYFEDDLIDGYIYRKSAMRVPMNPSLSDGPCRDSSGRVDYDLMLEDVHKEMCKADRLFCVKNWRTGRTYQCGNPRAIPLELLYGEG